jgi:prophage DNA circulation protein
MAKTFDAAQISKLNEFFAAGIQIAEERAALSDSLKELTTSLAEELDVKPGLLSKALNIAVKATFSQQEADFEVVGDILRATHRNF